MSIGRPPGRSGDAWTRAPLDLLAHALAHEGDTSDSGQRHALVAFDQAVEGWVTAYLIDGPGRSDTSKAANQAREGQVDHRGPRYRRGPSFHDKTLYLRRRADQNRPRIRLDRRRISKGHEIRNAIQHRGRWVTPEPSVVEAMRDAAMAAQRLFAPGVAATTPAVSGAAYGLLAPSGSGPSPPSDRPPGQGEPSRVMAFATLGADSGDERRNLRRQVAGAAYEIAREIDPLRDGLHVSALVPELRNYDLVGIDEAPELELERTLEDSTLLFATLEDGVFAWREPETASGLRGKQLANHIRVYLTAVDPWGHGLHYADEILPGLQGWGTNIHGADPSRTVKSAMDDDRRGLFRKVRLDDRGRSPYYALEDPAEPRR